MDIRDDFLKARLDEEEKLAHDVCATRWIEGGVDVEPGDTWYSFPGGHDVNNGERGEGLPPDATAVAYDHVVAAYIASHDPARVLAEVAAKRKLADLHTRIILHGGGGAAWYDKTAICRSCAPSKQLPETAWPCQTIRVLAATYADHPDYDQAWRPEEQEPRE